MWYKNVSAIFFRFVTMHALCQTDEQTDGQRDRKALQYRALHYVQSHGKKTEANVVVFNVLCRPSVWYPVVAY